MIKKLARKRVRLFPGREGQSLVLMALLIPVLLVFAAFVVDGAHAFVDYRHLQNAADASSLAAAQDINSPSCGASPIPAAQQLKCVQDEVTDYAHDNGEWPVDSTAGNGLEIQQCGGTGVQPPNGPNQGDVEACFEWPYNGSDTTRVLVKIRDCTATFIGKFIGVDKICSSVRSVSISNPQTTTSVIAGTTIDPSTIYNPVPSTTVINGTTSVFTNTTSTVIPGTTTPGTTVYNTVTSTTIGPGTDALFAMDTTCDGKHGIVVGDPGNGGSGNGAIINGTAWSNGSVNINGNPQTHVTKAVYNSSPPACKGFSNGKVDSSATDNGNLPWLQTWDGPSICSGAPAAQKSAAAITITAGSHASGIWCSDTSITVTGNGTDSMNVTLIAPQIHIPAQNITFSPAVQGLLFYLTCGNGAPIPACVTDNNQPGSSCTLSGSAASWPQVTFCFSPNNASQSGDIWVPHGAIVVAGNSGPSGLWQAQDVIILGNSFTLTGTGGSSTTLSTTTVPTTTIGGTTIPTTVTSLSTGTITTPDTTSTTTSTNTITIPGTTQPSSTTTKTTGTNLALNQ
jgi:hypothetical protein